MDPVRRTEAERDASDIIARLELEVDDILSLIVRPAFAGRWATAERPAPPPSGEADRPHGPDPGAKA